MVGNKQAIVKKALYLEEICWGNRIEVAATAQSNNPLARRPYKDGWLSSRSYLRRVTFAVRPPAINLFPGISISLYDGQNDTAGR